VSNCTSFIFLASFIYLCLFPVSGIDEEIRRLGH
jgi:hypothetical protein